MPLPSELRIGVMRAVGRGIAVLDGSPRCARGMGGFEGSCSPFSQWEMPLGRRRWNVSDSYAKTWPRFRLANVSLGTPIYFGQTCFVMLLFDYVACCCVKWCKSVTGFARVSAESNKSYPPLPWVLPVGLSAKALSSVFTLDWICRFYLFVCLSVIFTLHAREAGYCFCRRGVCGCTSTEQVAQLWQRDCMSSAILRGWITLRLNLHWRVTFRANVYGVLDRGMVILRLCCWKFSHKGTL